MKNVKKYYDYLSELSELELLEDYDTLRKSIKQGEFLVLDPHFIIAIECEVKRKKGKDYIIKKYSDTLWVSYLGMRDMD